MEQSISPAYLKRLDRLYEAWIASYSLSEVLVIDTSRINYVDDLVDQLDVMERVEQVSMVQPR